MIGRLWCSVPVFLMVALTVGCKSSAKQGLTERIVSEAESIVMVQAQPEQPLGLERPFILPQHPPSAIPPDANIDSQIPFTISDPDTGLKILAVTPETGIDFKIASVKRNLGIDYKMLVVPEQKQSPRTIGNLDVRPTPEFRPLPKNPSLPWNPRNQQQGDRK